MKGLKSMYKVRRAEPTDAEWIVEVARRTWNDTYEGIIPRIVQDQALTEWYAVDRIARQATNHRGAFFVTSDDQGTIVAFAHLAHRRESGDAELMRIYVYYPSSGCSSKLRRTTALGEVLMKRWALPLFVSMMMTSTVT